VLKGWARELGIELAPAGEAGEEDAMATPAGEGRPAVADDAIRTLAIKGYCDGPGMAVALACAADEATSLLDLLVAEGLAELSAGSFRLTPDGRAVGAEKLAEDREAWGPEAATAALDAFVALDRRMKQIVTSWQMKGEGVLNDHADAAYDAAVLASLAELHVDVEAWLTPLIAGLPRLARYGARLSAAAAAAAAGNGKYIASPRVDSYHGVWFELHEDLILLAGRSRADEVAAGRA
jgi:pyruvate,orthophosphate dikinase